jgi:hypothetical protein
MKKLLLSFALAMFMFSMAQAQQISKKDVPPQVLKSYMSQNSKGTLDSVWSKQVMSIYKVNYTDEGRKYEAQYLEDGGWVKTFTEITPGELLPAINNQITQLYPTYKVARAFIELNNEGKFYAVDLLNANGKDKLYVYFLMSGKIVK